MSPTPTRGNGQAALALAGERGWLVFPIHHPTDGGCSCGHSDCATVGKHPMNTRGCSGATRELDRIARFWEQHPDANVAVATGFESGIFVVDIDAGHDGYASLAQLEHGHDRSLSTLECATGGGGSHLYFAWPAGVASERLRNSASKLGQGLDIRAAGGYVLAPSSLHRSGERYTWCDAYTEPLAAPGWLVDQLLPPPQAAEPSHRARRATLPFAGRPRGPAYVARALDGEVAQLLTIPEGQRHDQLVKSATRIGTLLHLVTDDAEAEAIGEALIQTGQDMGLDEKEARDIADAQFAYGRQHPRTPR